MVEQHENRVWPDGHRAVVSLTYDDGIPAHFERVAPQLEDAGLRGTFYVPVYRGLIDYSEQWRELVERGHELGNHSLFHPCRSNERRAWDKNYDLIHYDERRWNGEMEVANFALQQVDGKHERSFGNTCYDILIGPEDAPIALDPHIRRLFTAARGEQTHKPVNLQHLNIYNLGTAAGDYRTFDEIRPEMEAVVEQGGWIIYTMHGVGSGTHNHFIEQEEHDRMVAWLGKHQDLIWTAPLLDVVQHLKS